MSVRTASTLASKLGSVDAVVAGAGPCGVAVVGNLLENLKSSSPRSAQPASASASAAARQLWVDPAFGAGRIGAKYGEVPSNTTVELFTRFATALEPFRRIIDTTPAPNAISALRGLPQAQGCRLQYAVDMCQMLTDGVAREFGQTVGQHRGRVTEAVFNKNTSRWLVSLDNQQQVETPRLVLCTGSSPINAPLPPNSPARLDLDVALKPSLLESTLHAAGPNINVAVVGASHSAILVLMNLYHLASTASLLQDRLKISWFTRHTTLKYAKPMPEGWILYDNTGLKGQAAQWARANLEGDDVFYASPVSKVVTRIHTAPLDDQEEDKLYREHLPACTHIVQGIGYQRDPVPALLSADDGKPLDAVHDPLSGRFFAGSSAAAGAAAGRTYIPGLYGAGIAFPEQTTDPYGNVETSVGLWKFMRFLKRVVPEWVEKQ